MTLSCFILIIEDGLIPKIQNNRGLSQFVNERSKFEGWLKVELIDSLIKAGFNAIPEKGWIDITFDDVAIEIKTINTNYRYREYLTLIDKRRPISKNISGVLKDIDDLKSKNFTYKFVVFIVFPLNNGSTKWMYHIDKIESELNELRSVSFQFENRIWSKLYVGKI